MSDEYVILCMRHTARKHYVVTLWGPNSCGYTPDLNKAGRYTKEKAESINHNKDDIMVSLEDALRMSIELEYNYNKWEKGRFILNNEVLWNTFDIDKKKLYNSPETLKQYFRYITIK